MESCNCHHLDNNHKLIVTVHSVTQTTPTPVLSCIAKAPKSFHHVSHIPASDSGSGGSSNCLLDVHITRVRISTLCFFLDPFLGKRFRQLLSQVSNILRENYPKLARDRQRTIKSAQLMDDFLHLARENTEKDLETCGVLGAHLEQGTYYVTTLIIPKQESSSNSCEAIKEEEYFSIQNERSLVPVGWIHTHPSQSCFMSSIDLHTHYSYQAMVPEAFAIVMAPTDISRSYGIFRLSDPGGMSVLKHCQERGFHPHREAAEGVPIYEQCSNVYTNSNLRFEIFDLR